MGRAGSRSQPTDSADAHFLLAANIHGHISAYIRIHIPANISTDSSPANISTDSSPANISTHILARISAANAHSSRAGRDC